MIFLCESPCQGDRASFLAVFLSFEVDQVHKYASNIWKKLKLRIFFLQFIVQICTESNFVK